MIVCVCNGVTDKQIKEVVAEGKTIKFVKEKTKAGTCCGICVKYIKRNFL